MYSVVFNMDRSSKNIVITGISGNFPASENVCELRDNLFNKNNMVSGDDRRWAKFHPEIPHRSGKISGVNDFDIGFFGIAKKAANVMDPIARIALEKVYEAMIDSGHHPGDFETEKCGVYVGTWAQDGGTLNVRTQPVNADTDVRCTKMMLANNICYYFKLNGVSMVTDAACGSSFYALDAAYTDMRRDKCDKAIVCGLNLSLHPHLTLQLARLGVLSVDGSCKSFDDAANGYVRSEAIVAIILERKSDARRIYAELIHSKTNCDGFKQESITFPSSEMLTSLMKEFYQECKVDPKTLTFLEAHATGTKVGDGQELGAITNFFLKNREKPLYIGTVRSNFGHTEAASGLCSLVKVIVGMEAGFIPPNINYSTPKKGVNALETGMLKVVTEKIPWPDNEVYVGINSYGFGGANCHILLRWNTKQKVIEKCGCDMPTLICVNGRSEEAVMKIFDDVSKMDVDAEFIKLIHQVYAKPIPNNNYHGYMIFGKGVRMRKYTAKKYISGRRLCIIFNAFEGDSHKIHAGLKMIPKYLSLLKDIQNIVQEELEISMSGTEKHIPALILANILKSLNVSGYVRGIGFGKYPEIVAAYFNNAMTFKQAVLALFGRTTFKTIKSNEIQTKANTTFLIVGDDVLKIQKARKIHLINANEPEYPIQLLQSLGTLYLQGFSIELDQIYPEVQYPVSRGTPMLSPLVKWDHRYRYYSYKFIPERSKHFVQDVVHVTVNEPAWNYIAGHLLDGRNLFPAAGYVFLAWKTFSTMMGKTLSETAVVLEDVRFLRAASIGATGSLDLKVAVSQGSNSFTILEGNAALVTGEIYFSNSEKVTREYQPISKEGHFIEQKDVYKEFKLRGYDYQGEFKAIQSFDIEGNSATISWKDNWTTFINNMCQLHLLQQHTRNLYIPTSIKKIIINPKEHEQIAMLYRNQVPVHCHKDLNLVSAGGIQISGMAVSSITRKKPAAPVLETHKFVPYEGKLELHHAVRCMVQMVLENANTVKVKSVEVLDSSGNLYEPMMPLVQQTLKDLPLIEANLKILSKRKDLDLESDIVVKDSSLDAESGCLIVIARDILQNSEILSVALRVTQDVSGFVITTCSKSSPTEVIPQINILSSYETERGRVLLIKESSQSIERIPISIPSIQDLSWLEYLQGLMSKNVVLYSQNVPLNGVLGLVNCLRKEALGNHISAVVIGDDAPSFDVQDPFFKSQLDKNLVINVFKYGKWGSYRHLLLPDAETVKKEHCYIGVTTRGDLSSLRWIQGPLSRKTTPEAEKGLVDVYYSAINFRDVMIASGKVSANIIMRDKTIHEGMQGLEFSGKLKGVRSKRVMGLRQAGALSTLVMADPKLLWTIPDDWSLEDAATVPVAYGTALYAFIMRGRMKRDQSVLVHSGSEGVGQAAINVASHMGCTIFTTADTKQKREFIKNTFPEIKPECIGDSTSVSFEDMIRTETKGRGVDFVLNTLSREMFQASVRCLAYNGTLLDIGSFYLSGDNQLAARLSRKQARCEAIVFDQLLIGNDGFKDALMELVMEGMKNGSVKPLVRTTFPMQRIEKAYRYVTSGKHIGKVLIKVRNEHQKGHHQLFKGIPRLTCNHATCYVIVGGLGGFGLELADWLVNRGVKYLVLTSRSGIKNGYQSYRLNNFKSYGVTVVVRNDDIGTENGCSALLAFAECLGPVEGIFNLAVVLKDSLFENQTVGMFEASLIPKAYATQYLDVVSRKLCPNLRYFVVFSTASCGRGNAGQTNYGMANSVMERLCEERKIDGYPALAIQWGPIGDVGIMADNPENRTDLFKRGLLEQKIISCFETLDRLVAQDEPVVSSMVVAEKRSGSAGNAIVDTILSIIGITNLKIVNFHATFPEMGVDSVLALEVAQTLEREYKISLTREDIGKMTLAKLLGLEKGIKEGQPNNKAWKDDFLQEMKMILNRSNNYNNLNEPIVHFKTSFPNRPKVFAFPGISGAAQIFSSLTRKLNFNISSFQFCLDSYADSIESMAKDYVDVIASTPGDFNIIGYSFGCVVAIESMYILESRGKIGKALFIDDAPELITRALKPYLVRKDEKILEISLLLMFMSTFMPFEATLKHKVDIEKRESFEDKIRYVLKIIPEVDHSEKVIVKLWKALFTRIKALIAYQARNEKLKSKVVLVKPNQCSSLGIKEYYDLSKLTCESVLVKVFEGSHGSLLESDQMAEDVNKFFLNL